MTAAIGLTAALLFSDHATGGELSLSDQPLFLSSGAEPNVLFVLDTSRSMDWGLITPETHPTSVARGAIMRIETDTNGWDYFYATYAADNEQNAQDGVVPTQEAANLTSASAYMAGVWRARNADYNKLYYDPSQTYEPWLGVDSAGNAFADAVPSAARQDPYNASPTVNLTANTTFTTKRPCVSTEGCTTTSLSVVYVPARYWVWEDTNTTTPANAGNGRVDSDDTHTLVEIVSGKQCTSGQTPINNGCYMRSYTEELQNFANWWTYHRRREYAMKYAVSRVIAPAGNVRMGISTIHDASLERVIAPMNAAVSTGNKRNVLDTLFSINCDFGGTPLRSALYEAGKYFQCSGTSLFGGTHCPVQTIAVSPATKPAGECQQNFTILLTDGYYSGSFSALANEDNDASVYSDGGIAYRFDGAPYADGYSDTLADIAMHYYERDLHPGLANKVPTTCGVDENPAQHMTTYTVGFGVVGAIDPTALPAHPKRGYAPGCSAETGTAITWTDPNTNDGKIDDLVHAAYNGRGAYYSATRSEELSTALNNAIASIVERSAGSASALAFNSGAVRTGSQIYQGSFDSAAWTGGLVAFALHDGTGNNGCNVADPVGIPCPDPVWDASCVLTGGSCASTGQTIGSPNLGSAREILTFNTDTNLGIALSWTALSASQQAALNLSSGGVTDSNGQNRLAYLRGDRSNEVANGGSLRDRDSLLGDVVHSAPLYVGIPNRRYPGTWIDRLGGSTPENASGVQSYAAFMSAYEQRMTMVYVGANDGLLHGFETGKFDSSGNLQSGTNRGKELLAYMPSKVLLEARHLTYPDYSHRYYVDASPVENDVYFESDDRWHTVLVGGLGVGGQGLYALDITNPEDSSAAAPSFSESNADQLVLWEFTDDDDADLGYTLGSPVIVRLHNGDWGVVVGNGYNNTQADGAVSSDGDASLFILDVENGNVLAKLDTQTGKAEDPTGQNRPNALASVFPVDKDADFITDYVYAGDLFGNVWRFDLTATSAGGWMVSEFGTGSPSPLFTAVDAGGNPQPITTRVIVGAHPNGLNHGVMAYFGTGKYLEDTDAGPDTTTTQTFYGIWDKDFFGVGASIDVLSGLASAKKTAFSRTSDLQAQAINAVESVSGVVYRRVTDNGVDYAAKHGWYLDLKLSSGSNEGEMVITDPVLRGEAVTFTTFIPSANPCESGGSGFLMTVNKNTGGRLVKSPFDINSDGNFTIADYLGFGDSGQEAASGRSIVGGQPGFVLSKGKDVLLSSQVDGTIHAQEINLGIPPIGRRSWRQLR